MAPGVEELLQWRQKEENRMNEGRGGERRGEWAGRTRWKLWATTGVSVIHLTWERSQDLWKTRQHSVISTISRHAVMILPVYGVWYGTVRGDNAKLHDYGLHDIKPSWLHNKDWDIPVCFIINQQAPGIWPVKTTELHLCKMQFNKGLHRVHMGVLRKLFSVSQVLLLAGNYNAAFMLEKWVQYSQVLSVRRSGIRMWAGLVNTSQHRPFPILYCSEVQCISHMAGNIAIFDIIGYQNKHDFTLMCLKIKK